MSFDILLTHVNFNHDRLRRMFIMASMFYKIGSDLLGTTMLNHKSKLFNLYQHIGALPHTCDVLHKTLKKNHKNYVSKLHLLWSLHFSCEHPKVKNVRKNFGADVKSFRKHTTYIIICVKKINIASKSDY